MLSFVVLSSIFLVSCGGSQDASTPSPTSSVSPISQSYAETLDKTSSKIKNTQEFEECMKPSVNMCVTQVGNQLARSQKSSAFCDEMNQWDQKDACKYGVVMSQISENKDIKQCDTLNEVYAKECRINVSLAEAIESGDIKKCDSISVSTSPDNLWAIDRADQCRSDVLIRNTQTTSSDCDALKSGPSKDMCKAIVNNRQEMQKDFSIN